MPFWTPFMTTICLCLTLNASMGKQLSLAVLPPHSPTAALSPISARPAAIDLLTPSTSLSMTIDPSIGMDPNLADTSQSVPALQCCRSCGPAATQGLLQPLPVPSGPCESVSTDFVTGLPTTPGNDAMLVLIDGVCACCSCCYYLYSC